MFAVRMRLGRSRSGPAWTCIEDLRVRTSSVAARSARPPRSYRVRHRRLELWTPPQERRGLCQAPDTRMWLNARKVEDETSSIFARKHTVGKVDCLAFQRAIPNLLNPTTRPSRVRTSVCVCFILCNTPENELTGEARAASNHMAGPYFGSFGARGRSAHEFWTYS